MSRISVVVPVYNVEKYLNRCVDSILNQTFRDFELILVDDGSKDKSGEICDEYAQKDKRVRVIHKENGGVSKARNIGIDMALGEYIMFVDSDDYIDKVMLEELTKEELEEYDLVVSSIRMMTNKGELYYSAGEKMHDVKTLLEDYCMDSFSAICLNGPWCKRYRLDILKQNGIYFNSELSLGEDTVFNFDYIQFCDKIRCMAKSFYYYMRENELSLFSGFQYNTYEQTKLVEEHIRIVLERFGCSCKAKRNRMKNYVNIVIGNLIKCVYVGDIIAFRHYCKVSTQDKNLKDYLSLLEGKNKVIAAMLLSKQYYTIYCILKARNFLRK